MPLDVKNLGQVFSPEKIVEKVLALRKNHGRTLEPSCGDGAFSTNLPGCVAIEYDAKVCPKYALNMDFFDYPESEKFTTIIGNPPYVLFKNIEDSTARKLNGAMFTNKANLYLFFIEKCIRHLAEGGELLFITPRDFLKASAARKLNRFLFESGTITDIEDLGDMPIFPGYSPNCVIFRFEKGNFSRITNQTKTFLEQNGQLFFVDKNYDVLFKDLFFVKVGAASGADNIFTHETGNQDFVCSYTRATGKTRRMIYQKRGKHLEQFKGTLISRKIKRFTENNWWEWGRQYFDSNNPRIYVNAKTRQKNPFFTHESPAYDGAILAIFARNPAVDIAKYVDALNNVDWDELGFMSGGRYIFSQRSLEECLLPSEFAKIS